MRNWLIGTLLVLLGAAAYYYFAVYQPAEPVTAITTTVPAAAPASDPGPATLPAEPEVSAEPEIGFVETPAPQVEEMPLPMLMESDPVVLDTLEGMIGEAAVMQYLVNDNLISRMVATVVTMGGRQIPGVVQVVQGPESDFEATVNDQAEPIRNQEGDEIPQFVVDPANYRRYTPYVELLEAVDTATLVENFDRHYSLFQQAYRQMGYADGEFSERLLAVIDEMLATPEVTDPVNLVKPEAYFLYTNPDLESRTAAQKILLRMGPENASRVKLKLSEIRTAL
jgi:hypothetical protein